jgi:hypothetical protein
MALEVTVGPPVITNNNGHTFLVSELDGSITPASDQGLYSHDTRYLTGYQLYINGASWTLLNSGAIAFYASQTYLINPRVVTEEGVIAPGAVGLLLSRTLGWSSAGRRRHREQAFDLRAEWLHRVEPIRRHQARRHRRGQWRWCSASVAAATAETGVMRCLPC